MSSEEFNTKTQRHQDTKSEDDISHQIIGAAIEVHRTLGGPGLLESIYESALCHVLTYLRLMGIKLGLLVNFGAPYVKDGVSRIINGIL